MGLKDRVLSLERVEGLQTIQELEKDYIRD